MNSLLGTLKQVELRQQFSLSYKRLLLPIAIFALLISSNTQAIVVDAMADSFWAVSCYIAATLTIYHYSASILSTNNRLTHLYHKSRYSQVVFASLLGALPGCGGAIVVITQFASRKVGFGSVVAVLTATMGDAAFILIAAKPQIAWVVISIGVVSGMITGCIVNLFHKDDFLQPKKAQTSKNICCTPSNAPSKIERKAINIQGFIWGGILIPCTVIALLDSFQVDLNALINVKEGTIEWIGASIALLNLFIWALTKKKVSYQSTVSEESKPHSLHPLQKVAQDTNFISAWVVGAFILFELTQYLFTLDLTSYLAQMGLWLPLVGLAVGFLPGCGPQILFTSLYLSGAVPLSAQLSNSISNDGDALFPILVMAPKAAIVATIYTAFPAFIVGYGYLFLFE